jgi:predicted HicB family RNase H-like nuclease
MADQQDLTYEGFTGSIEISIEDNCLHGRIQFIDDLITYEGNTISEIKAAFEDAVVRYLEHCKSVGKSPNKPYSGSFNVRIGPELHRQAAQKAATRGMSLNQLVTQAIQKDVVSEPFSNFMHDNQGRKALMLIVNNQMPAIAATSSPPPNQLSVNDMVRPYLN